MATDWVEMVHDANGITGRVPNKPNVIAARRGKGWRLASEPAPVPDAPEAPTEANEDDQSNTKSTRKARSRAADTEE